MTSESKKREWENERENEWEREREIKENYREINHF